MRINRLTVKNFKCFEERTFEFPQRIDAPMGSNGSFHLIIGENGAGKTSVLIALMAALEYWFNRLNPKGHNLQPADAREAAVKFGDRILFRYTGDVSLSVDAVIHNRKINWKRFLTFTTHDPIRYMGEYVATPTAEISPEVELFTDLPNAVYPIIKHYGATRLGVAVQPNESTLKMDMKPSRFDAYDKCLGEQIDHSAVNQWFLYENIAFVNGGKFRPGYEAVRSAVLNCVEGARELRFDPDRSQIVLNIEGKEQLYYNLSAGQLMMLGVVAEIAIKAVQLNSFLLDEAHANDPTIVLRETPGVVLIDELDAHLHPRWQRRIVDDLKRTFPNIQFIATSHSPFIIQTLQPGELISLDGLPLDEFGNRSIDLIARDQMGVERPDVAPRYQQMVKAAKDYLLELQEAAIAPEEKLAAFEKSLAEKIAPYKAENPAFQAFLELKHEVKLGPRKQLNGATAQTNGLENSGVKP